MIELAGMEGTPDLKITAPLAPFEVDGIRYVPPWLNHDGHAAMMERHFPNEAPGLISESVTCAPMFSVKADVEQCGQFPCPCVTGKDDNL